MHLQRDRLTNRPATPQVKLKIMFLFNVRRQQLSCLADGSKGYRLTILRAAPQRQSRDSRTSVSTGHIILTPAQPVGSTERDSNPGPSR